MLLNGPTLFAHDVMPILMLVIGMVAATSCTKNTDQPLTGSRELEESSQQPVSDSTPMMKRTPAEQVYAKDREQMVASQLASRDIVDQRVLDAMKRVPRHEFVPAAIRHLAYNDSPLPIGHQQTISQPYIVALMTQLVEPQPHMKALDIGTGSGYQAAVLVDLVKNVYSIEIVKPLAKEARERLQALGYKDITVRHGDGYQGWNSEAPFDIIIVAAAPDHVPQPLVDQLGPGGKMVIPVGKHFQNLLIIEKHKDGSVVQKRVAPVAFVPMTGEAQR
jgi:protein-L-isoaspartate(D-aspartate) O-methyltransferase